MGVSQSPLGRGSRGPQWGKCFLKDRSFTGSEPSAVKGSCETYFRIDCGLTTTTTTFAVGEGTLKAMIVSYNLYWWNLDSALVSSGSEPPLVSTLHWLRAAHLDGLLFPFGPQTGNP